MGNSRRIILGITGASGAIYAWRTLEALKSAGMEVHLVISKAGSVTISYELDKRVADFAALATHVHNVNDIAAPISSGSFKTMGMLIAPCSVRTMSEIVTGATSTLLTRSADVTLKERRRLVLMVRETPLHLGHLRTMTQLTEMGAIIAPPVPAFYTAPKSVDDVINQSVGRVLDHFDIDSPLVKRWGEDLPPKQDRRG